ncbi:MAG: hypothetical protein ACI9OJ_004176 [Myxococcota bacterium]|jgi:uncharacterized protein (TIRG00374 family)
MSDRAKTALKWTLGLLIGAFFVWLSARDWKPELTAGLGLNGSSVRTDGWSFNLWYLVPYLVILTAIHFLRVVRWYPLLKPIADVDFWRLNRVSAVGNMYLFILPFRLGELARPYLIADRGDVSMSAALGTIVVERVVDGLIVALVLFGVLFFLPGQELESFNEIRLGAYAALAVFGGALTVLVAMFLRREWTFKVLRAILRRISGGLADKIIGLLSAFYDGLAALPNPRYFASFVGWSIIYWALNGVGYYVLALGFPGLEIPLLAAYAMMCCVVVGMMLPNPPANVGVYWFFLLKPLALYGIAAGSPAAAAFGLLAWLGQLIQQGAFGLWFTARGKSRVVVPKSAPTNTDPALSS